MKRRDFFAGLTALVVATTTTGCMRRVARGGPARRRRRRRRRVRRRIRRRVAWRMVTGRRVAVVPVAMAVGWELALANEVVVVHAVRSPNVIVVRYPAGHTKEIHVHREDTTANREELQGSEANGDGTREIEEDVEE